MWQLYVKYGPGMGHGPQKKKKKGIGKILVRFVLSESISVLISWLD